MKPSHHISFRANKKRGVYACDINRRQWIQVGPNPKDGYMGSVRIATIPMAGIDHRSDQWPVPSYAERLLQWHLRRSRIFDAQRPATEKAN